MPLHIIFDHTPNHEAHARKLVKQVLDQTGAGMPLIPTEGAMTPGKCNYGDCDNKVWYALDSYGHLCPMHQAEEDAEEAARRDEQKARTEFIRSRLNSESSNDDDLAAVMR